jgi:hypothetical protein
VAHLWYKVLEFVVGFECKVCVDKGIYEEKSQTIVKKVSSLEQAVAKSQRVRLGNFVRTEIYADIGKWSNPWVVIRVHILL